MEKSTGVGTMNQFKVVKLPEDPRLFWQVETLIDNGDSVFGYYSLDFSKRIEKRNYDLDEKGRIVGIEIV